MNKIKSTLSLMVLIGAIGSGIFLYFFEVTGLEHLKISQRQTTVVSTPKQNLHTQDKPAVRHQGKSIRVASFNIQVFGSSKSKKRIVMERLAKIIREFDVVAIQEIRSKDQSIIPNFVNLINAGGRNYDYVIGERLGRTSSKEQYAYIFDTASIEVDRSQIYTVSDPSDLMHREPLVAQFRVRGPPPGEAFTFSLVNIHTDPDETKQELNALDDVYRMVLNDGRGEDDVIILGDLNVNTKNLGELGQIPGIAWVIEGVPTNTRGTKTYDNIIYHSEATREFIGRGGVYDLMRVFNITKQEALAISDHMPVWAEFSLYESKPAVRTATKPKQPVR